MTVVRAFFHVVQTRTAGDDNYVSYLSHFQYPDSTPPDRVGVTVLKTLWGFKSDMTQAAPSLLSIQPPTTMQDTAKTLEIYAEALYPTLRSTRVGYGRDRGGQRLVT